MKTLACVLLGSLAVLGSVGAAPDSTTPVQGIRDRTPEFLAFSGATVVVSPDRTVASATIVVRDGKIESVEPDGPVPPGARVVDLAGKRIYPGFIDPYTEYGLAHVGDLNPPTTGSTPKLTGTRVGANAWNDAVHAERDWVDRFLPDEDTAASMRKLGFTATQSARMDGVFRGTGLVASLAPGEANDLLLSPRSMGFLSFDKGSSRQLYPGSLMGSIALVRQTLLDADWYAAARTASERRPGVELPEFNRAVEALADRRGPFVFETGDELTLLRAARIAEEFSLDLVYLGSNREYARMDEIRAVGGALILPLVFPARPAVESFESQLDVNLSDLRHWERAPSNAAALHEAGVEFAFTTHRLGKSKQDFWDAIRRVVKRGLDPRVALASLTTVPARLLGIDSRAGTLEPGMRADFFVTDGDPFVSPASPLEVWIEGERVEAIEPSEAPDFRGVFRLELEERPYELRVRRAEGKRTLSGELVRGRRSLSVEALEATANRLSFRAKPDPDDAGPTRFTLLSLSGEWSGRAVRPDGTALAVPVIRTAERAPAKKPEAGDGEATRTDDAALVSRLTAPDAPFGFEVPPARETVLVRGGTIWTGESAGILDGADLLVREGRIAAIGVGLEAPAGATVIDAAGKHVTAGIIDEHSHIAISRGVNEGSHAATAEVRIGDVVNPDDVSIYRALAGGVTAAQLLHGSANPIGGQAQVIKLRWGASAEGLKFRAAPPSIKFALGENVKQSNWGDGNRTRYPQSRMGVETFMRDRLLAARRYGQDRLRYEALPEDEKARALPPRRDLQLEALLEIVEGRRFVHCHSYVQSEILMLMRLAEDLGFRIQTFTHILEGYKVADEMAAHGATASSFSDWWAYKFEVYDAIPYNTCLLHERGVVVSVNSDSGELIRRLNHEAAKSVMYCGMDPHEALKLVTLNPAIQLRVDDRVGSLREGKDADFVIWSGDPLSVYSKAEQTWIEGARYFDIERDLALRERDRAEKQALIRKALQSDESGDAAAPDGGRREKIWHCDDVEDVWHAQGGR